MTKLLPTFFLLLLVTSVDLLAQTGPVPRIVPARVEDAIRFANTDPLGSARFMGTGGSMTAIGVDYTTLHTNPAGIGWNRYNKAQLTGGFVTAPTDATVIGNFGNMTESDSKPTVSLPSIGLVYTQQTQRVDWPTFNIGFGLTRLADFNESISYTGFSEGSVFDAVVEDLNDDFVDPFRSGLAFDINNALQQDELGFFSDFDLEENAGGKTRKLGTVERSGSMNEVALGAGGSWRDQVLWGVTLGIPFVNFTETKRYDEIDERDEITFFDDAGFDEDLTMSGSGVNFKFGLIYLPTPQFRLSAAVHSPTFWTIDETYETTLTYNFTDDNGAQGGSALSPASIAAVNLRTPWRFLLGGGYLVGSSGFVSLDVDYSNYAGTSFSFDDFSVIDDATNADIDATLGSSLGVKLGGEINVKPFQVRAGVGYRTIPQLETRNDEAGGTAAVSLGAGWAKGKFFVDAALRGETYNGFYAPYRTFNFDGAVVDTERVRLIGLVTVGYRGW